MGLTYSRQDGQLFMAQVQDISSTNVPKVLDLWSSSRVGPQLAAASELSIVRTVAAAIVPTADIKSLTAKARWYNACGSGHM
jgi:hypothetical protein